jgi:hypothetical protein
MKLFSPDQDQPDQSSAPIVYECLQSRHLPYVHDLLARVFWTGIDGKSINLFAMVLNIDVMWHSDRLSTIFAGEMYSHSNVQASCSWGCDPQFPARDIYNLPGRQSWLGEFPDRNVRFLYIIAFFEL